MLFKKNNTRLKHEHDFSRLLTISLLILSSLVFSSVTVAQDTTEQTVNRTIKSTHLESNESRIVNTKGEYNLNEESTFKPVIKDAFEWQFIMDFSFVYDPTIIAGIKQEDLLDYFMPGILVDLSYKGFFLQSNQRRSYALLGGTELGYQLIVEDNWQFDLIGKAYMQGYDSASLIEYGGGDENLLVGLREREATAGIALRYSYYFEDALFSLDIASAHSGDDEFGDHVSGLIIDSFYSYLLPYRNWDIYLGAGLTYFSQDIVDYYIGVSADETTDFRAEYTAKDGVRAQFEVYVQYPLSASWSFNAGLTHSVYSNNVKESPLVNTNQITQVMLGALYVF
jgi:outer membrane scaffolding protein for murein synthesis (MipA/OmpV family)